ncbi:MAG: RNA methyltransferase [Synergistaceae bacterium]|nr:RNA methyltransferase [Synergistaceae bacterium]
MRGIEGALFAVQSAREGRFIGETLRSLGDKMPVTELSLASSLAYGALRREALWKKIFGAYLKGAKGGKPPEIDPAVSDCLLLGAAGLMELRHFAPGALVNGLLEALKAKGHEKAVPMVNAVLHNVARNGPGALEILNRSRRLEDRAVCAGIPEWTLPAWKKSWSNEELNDIFAYSQIPPCASLRTPPNRRDEVTALLSAGGFDGVPSDLFPESIRLSSTVYPSLVPGFGQGLATVQTESSMLAASLVSVFWRRLGGTVLDMCSGRGVKAGQIAQSLPDARIECWEVSPGRHRAAVREMARLGIGDRVVLRLGDALSLSPQEPVKLVFLDAPCTGSGTWNRKPESKWGLSWAKVDKMGELQRALLKKALTLVGTGGIIIYVTCSLLRQENENVVADALSETADYVVLDAPLAGAYVRRGRPWGTYILPGLPWLDGFYVSVIMKRTGA